MMDVRDIPGAREVVVTRNAGGKLGIPAYQDTAASSIGTWNIMYISGESILLPLLIKFHVF